MLLKLNWITVKSDAGLTKQVSLTVSLSTAFTVGEPMERTSIVCNQQSVYAINTVIMDYISCLPLNDITGNPVVPFPRKLVAIK